MLYAVGKPGEPVRQYYDAGIFEMRGQVRDGEVAVPAERRGAARITTDGALLAERTPVTPPDITTAVQLATTITVPAGATWTAKGQSFTGPQDITFAAAGDYAVKMTGQWVGIGMVTVLSAADYRRWLIDHVKAEGERRSMLVMSTGGSKQTKYPIKSVEIENWYELGGVGAATSTLLAAFNLLNTTVRKRKFRFAIRDAAAHGDTVAAAIARFVAGADTSLDETARLEGIEQAGVDAIRAATSSAAALAAFRAINWAAA